MCLPPPPSYYPALVVALSGVLALLRAAARLPTRALVPARPPASQPARYLPGRTHKTAARLQTRLSRVPRSPAHSSLLALYEDCYTRAGDPSRADDDGGSGGARSAVGGSHLPGAHPAQSHLLCGHDDPRLAFQSWRGSQCLKPNPQASCVSPGTGVVCEGEGVR